MHGPLVRQEPVNLCDGGSAFPDGPADPFDGPGSHVAHGEHPGHAGFQRCRALMVCDCRRRVAGEHESGSIERDRRFTQPARLGVGSNEQEDVAKADAVFGSCAAILPSDRGEPAGLVAVQTDDLCMRPQLDIGR